MRLNLGVKKIRTIFLVPSLVILSCGGRASFRQAFDYKYDSQPSNYPIEFYSKRLPTPCHEQFQTYLSGAEPDTSKHYVVVGTVYNKVKANDCAQLAEIVVQDFKTLARKHGADAVIEISTETYVTETFISESHSFGLTEKQRYRGVLIKFLETSDQPSRLSGTVWTGVSNNKPIEYRFIKKGILHFKDPRGLVTSDCYWRQEGNTVLLSINDGYVKYKGTLTGNKIKGTAKNKPGKRWEWEVVKQ